MLKNPQFQEEKISARKQGRSHVNMEKSSKNLISLFGEKPARGLPKPPLPQCVENQRSLHVEKARMQEAGAKSRRGIGTRREWEGRGENNTKLNNSSTGQHFVVEFHTKIAFTFLLLIALTKCAYLLLALLASKNRVLYSEGRAYKREPELAASSQSTTLYNYTI